MNSSREPITGSLVEYQLRLPGFEGPLDLLLRLIERDQMAITEVSLISVTDQFIAHIALLRGLPAATIAEFAVVAGRLVLLKSRSLIPRPLVIEDSDPEGLIRQLEAYRALRCAVEALAASDAAATGAFPRGGAVVRPLATQPRLANHLPSLLTRSLRRRLAMAAPRSTTLGIKPIISLREMAERLVARLSDEGRPVSFRESLGDDAGRTEHLVGFLAVLALLRRRLVAAEQTEHFGEIWLIRRGDEGTVGAPTGDDRLSDQR